MVADPAVIAELLVGLVVKGHRLHQAALDRLAVFELRGDQGRVRLPPQQPRDFLIRQFGQHLLILLGHQGLARGAMTAGAEVRAVIFHALVGQVEMAEHALLVRRLPQALDAVLGLTQVANAAGLFLALDVNELVSLFIEFMVATGAVVLAAGRRRDLLGVHVAKMHRLVQAGVQPDRLWRLGVVAAAAQTVRRPARLAGGGRLHVAADAVLMIEVFDRGRLRRRPALEGQGQLAVIHGVAGFAGLLLLKQHVGVLIVGEGDRRQLQFPVGRQGVNLDQVRPPQLRRWHRLRRLLPALSPDTVKRDRDTHHQEPSPSKQWSSFRHNSNP